MKKALTMAAIALSMAACTKEQGWRQGAARTCEAQRG